MYLSQTGREDVYGALQFYDDNDMDVEIKCFYETARRYLTIPELLDFYTLDDIIRNEYDIKHAENLQRDIEALWENRMEELVKEP